MEARATRAQGYARAHQVALAGPLCEVPDWSSVAATTVTVRAALREEFPGTGGAAAMQVHTVRSVGCGAPVPSHVRAARDHDSPPRPLEEAWRGDGLVADGASASWERLRAWRHL